MSGKDSVRNPSSLAAAGIAVVVGVLAAIAAAGPVRAGEGVWDHVLETLDVKAPPADPAPAFVERTRPDPAGLGYIPTALPHKVSPRPVRSPAEVQAATAALDAARDNQLKPGGPAPVQIGKRKAPAAPKSAAAVAD